MITGHVAKPFHRTMLRVLTWLVLAAFSALALSRAAEDVPVQVRLRHGWHEYGAGAMRAAPFLEMLEAVHAVWPSDYFRVLARVWAPDGLGAALGARNVAAGVLDATPEKLYTAMDTLLSEMMAERHGARAFERMDEWRMHVALHSQAARIEAYYQLYNTSAAVHALDAPCATWAHIRDAQYCDAEAAVAAARSADAYDDPISLDHIYPVHRMGVPTAVLYVDPLADETPAFHAALQSAARDGSLQYVLRWRPSGVHAALPTKPSSYLSGFGVTMHLKKVDYLVLDDRRVHAPPAAPLDAPDRVSELSKAVQAQLLDGASDAARAANIQDAVKRAAELNLTEIMYMGQAVAHAVHVSEDPLSTLEALVYNFPAHALALSDYARRVESDSEVFALLEDHFYRFIAPGVSQLWINGHPLPLDQLNPMALLSVLHKERGLLAALAAPELGISPDDAQSLLTDENVVHAFGPRDDSADTPLYDASDRPEGGDVVTWINDLEDGSYNMWPQKLSEMAGYTWPSGFPLVARNFFHLIVVPDVSRRETFMLFANLLRVVLGKYALRIGLVPMLGTASDEVAVAVWMAAELLDVSHLADFFTSVAQMPGDVVDAAEIRAELGRVLDAAKVPHDATIDAFVDNGQISAANAARLDRTRAYMQRLRPQVAHNAQGAAFFNGLPITFSDYVLHEIYPAITVQMRLAMQDLLNGVCDNEDDICATYFYDLPETRASRSILRSRMETDDGKHVLLGELFEQLGEYAEPLRLALYGGDRVTVRIVGDLDTPEGVALVQAAATAAASSHKLAPRVSFVHTGGTGVLSDWLGGAMAAGTLASIRPHALVEALSSADVPAALHALAEQLNFSPMHDTWVVLSAAFLALAQLDVSQPVILVNGFALEHVGRIHADEIHAAVEWEDTHHIQPLLRALAVPNEQRDVYAQALEFVSSLLSSEFGAEDAVRVPITTMSKASPLAKFIGMGESLYVTALIDPLSPMAPALVAATRMLAEQRDVQVTLLLNPRLRTTSLPLQHFTRYDLRKAPLFDSAGNEMVPSVVFRGLPQQAVLTTEMNAPRSLVTMAAEAVYDLDNLRLADVRGRADVVYAVNSVLIEGHARDIHGPPPRGLQLDLTTDDGTTLDTIVMENLGYFQFRAHPGRWRLEIRSGRSADLYEWADAHSSTDIVLDSALGRVVYPRVIKRLGHERDELIVVNNEPPTLMGRLTAQARALLRPRPRHANINVFTLASGHLYERMTYIMILSVLRHTKSTVKFWFVENFLSPSFKAFIPHLAAAYHFDYELITFAWPRWLLPQTEKQRLIWAYKILFLDVLFPLDLDRVIFVDADQIVRADLKELVRTDLHGAPYGYPPMGDDSEDMDGYRFWKQGYWKTFLRGLPYHISALYVVDLQRFRQIGAGDMLRRHYQRLAADKNSLANLDQDLPNHRTLVAALY